MSAAILTMSHRELVRSEVMHRLLERRLSQRAAASMLGLCVRQTERLLARYRRDVTAGLISRKRGKPSNRQLPDQQTLPPLSTNREPASQLAEASKWFEALPNAKPKSEAELTARRERMDKAGLELLRSECRSGVCRLSFVYSKSSSERLKNRMNGHDSARGRPNWMSFTILRSDGRVEGHIFMVSGPGHGGGR
jgi:predicted DNA-binding transcriptional regulator YafY